MPDTDEALERPQGVGAAVWVFDVLKREIMSAELPPGTVLVEAAVAERFGVSRGPSREALQRLRRLGMVDAVARMGYVVSAVSLHDLEEIFQLREVLEPLTIKLVTERCATGKADLELLDSYSREITAVVEREEPEPAQHLADLNASFHKELARQSGNNRLAEGVSEVVDELERALLLLTENTLRLKPFLDDYPQLMHAIRSGDADEAAELMIRQLRKHQAAIKQCVLGTHVTVG